MVRVNRSAKLSVSFEVVVLLFAIVITFYFKRLRVFVFVLLFVLLCQQNLDWMNERLDLF